MSQTCVDYDKLVIILENVGIFQVLVSAFSSCLGFLNDY